MARPNPAFTEDVERFEGGPTAKGVAYWNSLRLRLAANRGDTSLAARARNIERSPRQMAALVTDLDNVDPYLVASLAGSRSMQDLAGVQPAGGRSDAPATMLELVARESAERHWKRCRTEPVAAKHREARWAGQREALRAGHLGPAFAALDATYGAACSVERQGALKQHPTVAPPVDYRPTGSYRLPGLPSERWSALCSRAAIIAQRPLNWGSPGDSTKHQRPRLEFIARGAARATQLAGRPLAPRVYISERILRVRLARALRRGPVATRRFLTSVASNPRRMAAAIRGRMDPVLVASAIGPEAVKNMLSGRKAQYPGPLGRFHEALERSETDRLAAVRDGANGARPPGVTDTMQHRALEGGLQGNRTIQDLTRPVVERVWTGVVSSQERGLPAGESPYDAWRRRRAFVASGMDQAEIGTALASQVDALDRSRGSSAADRDADRGQDWRTGGTGPRPGSDSPPVVPPLSSTGSSGADEDIAAARGRLSYAIDAELALALEKPDDWRVLPNGARIHNTAEVENYALVGPDAIIGPKCTVSDGAQVGRGARLVDSDVEPGSTVGDGVYMRAAHLDRDSSLGDGVVLNNAVVSSAARVGAGVVIDRLAHVEAGATVGDGTLVGERARVAANATVGERCHLVGTTGKSLGSDRAPADRTQVLEHASVGDDVVLGAGARVSSRADIGTGAVLGSGAVVRGRGVVGAGAHIEQQAVVGVDARIAPGARVPEGTTVLSSSPGPSSVDPPRRADSGPSLETPSRSQPPSRLDLVDDRSRAADRSGARETLDLALAPSLAKPEEWRELENGARVHQTATVHESAKVGSGAIIGPNANLDAGVVVGEKAVLMDCDLGEGARVDSQARVCGSDVGDRVHLAAGSMVNHANLDAGVRIGSAAIVERAAVVRKDVVVGDRAYVGSRVLLDKNASVGRDTHLVGSSPDIPRTKVQQHVVIGDSVVVGQASNVGGGSRVGDRAQLGDRVHLSPGVTVGEGAHIDTAAVVAQRAVVPPHGHVVEGSTFKTPGPKLDPASSPARDKVPDPSQPSPGSSAPPKDDVLDAVFRAQQAAAAQQRAGGPAGPSPGASDSGPAPATSSGPQYGPSSTLQATINVPASAVQHAVIPDADLPKLSALGNGEWKVLDDPYVDRVVARSDGSFDVVLHEGVTPAVHTPERVADKAPGDPASPSPDKSVPGFSVVTEGRAERSQDVRAANHDPFPAAFEAGQSSLDVGRRSVDSALAFNPASEQRFDGVDGQMLRSQAVVNGSPDDPRFATREEIETAGGKVRENAPGVLLMTDQTVAAPPLGADGTLALGAAPVEYNLRTPVVLYHVASQTDPRPDFPVSIPSAGRDSSLNARDLPASVGLEGKEVAGETSSRYEAPVTVVADGKPQGCMDERLVLAPGESHVARQSRLIDASVSSAVRRVGPEDGARPSPAASGTYADGDRSTAQKDLVERLAADRVASRIGSAYSPPPFSAERRAEVATVVKNPAEFQRLSKEADRVASWVVDGAKDRLHERGLQTSQERRDDFSKGAPAGERQAPEPAREKAAQAR